MKALEKIRNHNFLKSTFALALHQKSFQLRSFSNTHPVKDDSPVLIKDRSLAKNVIHRKLSPTGAVQDYGWITHLNNRSVIAIQGKDSTTFLQNLITNDMKLFNENEKRAAIFTCFLNPKGRILFDAFIVKPLLAFQKEDIEYWVDIEKDKCGDVLNHFKKYALRKDIAFGDISDTIKSFSVQTDYGTYNDEGMMFDEIQQTAYKVPHEDDPNVKHPGEVSFVDPRLRQMGVRILCPKESLEIDADIPGKVYHDTEKYDITRMLLGVPEGSKEASNVLPLNYQMHLLNGISFNKGCYIGQELTARTFHTGVLRKTIMSFLIFKDSALKINVNAFQPHEHVNYEFNDELAEQNLVDQDNKVLGKVVAFKRNCGLVLVEKEKLKKLEPVGLTIKGYKAIIWEPFYTSKSEIEEIEEEGAQEGEKVEKCMT